MALWWIGRSSSALQYSVPFFQNLVLQGVSSVFCVPCCCVLAIFSFSAVFCKGSLCLLWAVVCSQPRWDMWFSVWALVCLCNETFFCCCCQDRASLCRPTKCMWTGHTILTRWFQASVSIIGTEALHNAYWKMVLSQFMLIFWEMGLKSQDWGKYDL